MTDDRVKRRLAAILAADVFGFSRLMEENEAGTLANLRARRKDILAPIVVRHRGRVVKTMGDGVIVEFASAVDAVECAINLQAEMAGANAGLPEAKQIVLRVGVNLGDVVVEGSDIFGNGVNVAARLEALAQPGKIYISSSIYEEVRRKVIADFQDLGLFSVKNISDPVHAYLVAPRSMNTQTSASLFTTSSKPSLIILPFKELSGNFDNVGFVDGLTEDLITEVSRRRELFIIASHTSFGYKGQIINVAKVARDLGVKYVLEGSARREAERVRVNVQLIDCDSGMHLWSERFDRKLESIFEVQDEIAGRIVEALVGRLLPAPARQRPTSLEAYDLCVRSRQLSGKSPELAREAVVLLERAIVLEPSYAEAMRHQAFDRWAGWAHWGEPADPNRRLSLQLAEKAVDIDPNDAGNQWVLGHLLAYERCWERSDAAYAKAFLIDPNHADAWAMYGDLLTYRGQGLEGIENVQKALRLNPNPPSWYYWVLGLAQYGVGLYEEAITTLRVEATYRTGSRRVLAASLAKAGRLEEARQEAALFMVGNPRFTISYWGETQPFDDPEIREHILDGYRIAGLPE